jgi:hypothetical protein
MLTGLAALDATGWSKLYHAYGCATDTPAHLRALLGDDAEAREYALEHLDSAIVHQHTPWTATGPVALVIAGIIFDERLDQKTGMHDEPLRASLFSFLARVAFAAGVSGEIAEKLKILATFDIDPILATGYEAIFKNEKATNAFMARSQLGCIKVSPVLEQVMIDGLKDTDHRVRMEAANGVTALTRNSSLACLLVDLQSRLLAHAKAADNSDERSTYVLALGDLGASTLEFLNDPSPAVRLCAALATPLTKNELAIRELLTALEKHAGCVDGWFADRPPQFEARPRYYVIKRLIEEVKNFDRLVSVAEVVVSITSKWSVDREWGPLLAAAFPDGTGIVKNETQRRFLLALTKRADLWDPRNANAKEWFKKAGLPYDLQDCIRRANG